MSIINPTALPFSTVYSCTKRLGSTVCEHIRGKMAEQKGEMCISEHWQSTFSTEYDSRKQ